MNCCSGHPLRTVTRIFMSFLALAWVVASLLPCGTITHNWVSLLREVNLNKQHTSMLGRSFVEWVKPDRIIYFANPKSFSVCPLSFYFILLYGFLSCSFVLPYLQPILHEKAHLFEILVIQICLSVSECTHQCQKRL